MYRKTFEIFGKFIGRTNNVTIVYDMPGSMAKANLTKNILHLPTDIANQNAHKALALTMHEAAHVRWSKEIPVKDLCPMESDFEIVNAIEDIRIDRKNFDILPNVIGFYEELVKEHMNMTKPELLGKDKDAKRRLCIGILRGEGFYPKITKEDEEFMRKSNLRDIMMQGTSEIEHNDWRGLKITIEKIKKLLNIDPNQDKPNTKTEIRIGSGDQDGDGEPNGGDSGDGQETANIKIGNDPWKGIGKGDRMPGGSLSANPLAMDELCANQFKEILNVKEVKVIHEGSVLDTDNLISYHTGEIEDLFKEETTIRKKKSKIMFLIDDSGSMGGSGLLDGQSRAKVVKSSVMKLTEIIDEVRELEGINVDWSVGAFAYGYIPLTKENWQREYTGNGGGTHFSAGFEGAMQEMLDDYNIEGKRIIVVFTDGDVTPSCVDRVNEMIRSNHSDVRSLVIGVGSDFQGQFAKELVGDNIIVAEDNAVDIIIQTIRTML